MKRNPVPYAPIHLHSYFSLFRGCASPEEICSYARRRKFPALGLMDTNNFYGLVRFLNAAEAAGLAPLTGAVIAPEDRELCTALVLNRRGFQRLAELISGLGKIDPTESLLRRGWDGLALLSRDPVLLARLRRRSGTNLYAKLVYGQSFRPLTLEARRLGIPLCAVNDAWYLEPEDRGLGDLLRAMGENRLLEDLPAGRRLARENRVVSGDEMARFFSAVPEALQNAWALVERADSSGILSRGRGEAAVFPRFRGQSEADSFRMLKSLCLQGADRRYPSAHGGGPGPEVLRRLNCELNIIREKCFAGYFLVVRDIVARCPRTCGRGSSASSIVSYLLGITHVDPLRYNLFFERFLNRERVDPPDIDVDFPWDERETALRYVFERYRDRAGMVAEHVTFGPRSCLREPAKALGFAEEEIGRLVRAYRRHDFEHLPPVLLRAARRIRGFPRHLGTHCGGVVITPEPITCYTHVQDSPLGYPVIAWEKDAAEDAGLVKIDLLGNRSLAVLRDTLALVRETARTRTPGRQLSWEGFNPLDSRETRKLIASGDTLGIFYIESPATRQLLKKMRRGDYENLIIASSIIRPAANRYIREFVRRLHGAAYDPLHPLLEETLRETRGIMVYQEDVSRVAIDVAGFSPGEADRMRKLLTKRPHSLAGADFRTRFFRRGKERGVNMAVLEKIWDMMLSFAGYSFCKAHSASYALVSYRLAWLKRFYPLEFLVSVINNGGGYYTRQTYLNECRRLGFAVLAPDVNRSGLLYSVEAGGLRVGLAQLRDVSAGLLQRVVGERERGAYQSAGDFFQRLAPNLPETRILIRSGALDSLEPGLTRPQLFWIYFRLGRNSRMLVHPPLPAEVGDYPPALKLLDEIRTLGVVISCHPLTLFRRRISRRVQELGFPPLISSAEISARRGRRVSLAGLLVTGKEVLTRKKQRMIFVSFEDEHSVYETVFFPAAYRRFFRLLEEDSGAGLFLVCGTIAEDQGALSVTVERMTRFNWQGDLERSLEERPALPA